MPLGDIQIEGFMREMKKNNEDKSENTKKGAQVAS